MAVDTLIENIKTKIVIIFNIINLMTYLARVANSMVIFSASFVRPFVWPSVKLFSFFTFSALTGGYCINGPAKIHG